MVKIKLSKELVDDIYIRIVYDSCHYYEITRKETLKEILWFIPLSSKIDKYKKVIDKKIKSMVL